MQEITLRNLGRPCKVRKLRFKILASGIAHGRAVNECPERNKSGGGQLRFMSQLFSLRFFLFEKLI
jgi:hypothetical protein